MVDLALIAAVAKNDVIGNVGEVPWRIPADIKRFKELTMGHPVIMGRKTYCSIPEKYRPLKGRTNIIVSSRNNFEDYPEEVILCDSIETAIIEADERDNLAWVAGGEQVYRQTINRANRLEITEVHEDYDGDVLFPQIIKRMWEEVSRNPHPADGDTPAYDFVTYVSMWRS